MLGDVYKRQGLKFLKAFGSTPAMFPAVKPTGTPLEPNVGAGPIITAIIPGKNVGGAT